MTDNPFTRSDDLKNDQYKDASNLNARIRLHQHYGYNDPAYDEKINDLLNALPDDAAILEVGAGSGNFWQNHLEQIKPGWRIVLSDFSAGMLHDAQRNLADYANRFEYHVADAQDLPFDDRQFDCVMAHFMLYHVPDRPRAAAEFRRVLKPDGFLMATTNGDNHMHQLNAAVDDVLGFDLFANRGLVRPFTLQNGAEQLATAFADVTLIDRESYLKVTEAQPVVDFVLSMRSLKQMQDLWTDETTERFRALVQRHIDEQGYFYIDRENGTFIARGYAALVGDA